MARYARCTRCGEKDLFLMQRFIDGEDLKLCKKCYDEKIDKELTTSSRNPFPK